MSTKREQIIQLVKEYYREEFESKKKDFEPGDKISYGGRFFNDEEMCALVDSSLDFWLTTGRYAARFEKEMAQFLNVRFLLVDQFRFICEFVGIYGFDISEIGRSPN